MIPPMSRTLRVTVKPPVYGPIFFGIAAVGAILVGGIVWSRDALPPRPPPPTP